MSSASERPGRRWTLVTRLSTWYAGALLLGFALLGALAVLAVRRAMVRSNEVVIHERLERHRAVLGRVGLPQFEKAVAAAGELEAERPPVRVRNGKGQTLFRHGEVDAATVFASTSVAGDLVLDVAPPLDPWRRVGGTVILAVALVLFGCLLLGVAGGVYVTRQALRPVAALASTARAVIQSGDLSRRVDTREGGSGELEALAALVNRMLERNQSLVLGMREALDNVAHDLRTPLTRLRGVAEVALRGGDAAQVREALGDCIEESDRVLLMLRTLMDISEAEAGIMRLELAPVDLRALAAETIDLYEHVAEEAGVRLSLASGDDVIATVDANRIRQALANLVDNAVKYTPDGGTVELSVARGAGEAAVRVRDSGYGIPADAIPRIWDRLYRGDPSRATRGLGLGLSLVKAIATAHGGHVSVQSAPGAGSTFTLAVPLVQPARSGGQRDVDQDGSSRVQVPKSLSARAGREPASR
ncbi:MAG TPA: HAMP domain-containing sensor histidine kinase [Polyangia bacterium]